jgi:hypothetical protein
MNPKPSRFLAILILFLIQILTDPIVIAQIDNQRDLRISPQALDSWPRKAKRFALVIGVDEYQDTQITKLEGASNDAKALADALMQYSGFSADQVFLYSSAQTPEHRPTRSNILRRLSNLRSLVPKDGLLLISFSGHGIERDGRGYLLPSDAQVNGDIALLEETAINAEVVRKWIRDMGISQVVMIIDACRNNPSAGRGNTSKPLTETYANRFNFDVRNREVSAFATLYATEIGQVAYEYKERKQGYFTWALVEGLKGAAADENGEVTLATLVKYLQESVPKRVRLELGEERKQKPFAVIEGYRADDLVISVAGKGSVSTASPITPVQPVDSSAVELSFWDTIKNSTNPEDFKAYLRQYPSGRFAELAQIRANLQVSSLPPIVPKKDLQKVVGDFLFELQSCKRSGANIICQFLITNNSAQDKQLDFSNESRIFDEIGNEYRASKGKIGALPDTPYNRQYSYYTDFIGNSLVSQVPTKAEIKFENISPQMTTLKLLRLNCNFDGNSFSADFRDVSIEK